MKRHEALVALSRDHHFGLLANWKIKKGIFQNIEPQRIADYITAFYQNHLKPHFAEEEKYVFPILGENEPVVQQAKAQHDEIGALAAAGFSDYESLKNFGEILENHIRLEERELFQKLQESATDEQLTELAAREYEEQREMPWEDEFWK